jgi:WD40 repeat protein
MLSESTELRRSLIPVPRTLRTFLAMLVVAASPPAADAQQTAQIVPRPRLLDGALFWIGDPLKQKSDERAVQITALAFAPDGKHLIAGKDNGLVQTIDVARRQIISSVKAHESEVNAIVFRPGTPSYFTSGADDQVREWASPEKERIDFRTGSLIRGSPMTISADGRVIALGHHGHKHGRDDAVSFFDAASGKRLLAVRDPHGARAVAFSPDSHFLLSVGTWGNQVQLWDVEKGKLAWSRTEERAYEGEAVDASFLSGCSFGPTDEEYTVSIDNPWGDAEICIYDFKTGAVRKQFSSRQGHVNFAISPNGKTLAIGGYEAIIELCDLKTEKRLRTFFGQQDRVWCLAFSPDCRLLASGGGDGSVIVWDVTVTGRR